MNDGGCIALSPHRPGIIFYTGNIYTSGSGYSLGISRSTDDGATWRHDTIPLGSNGWAVAFDPTDSNRVYIAGDSSYSNPCLLITTDLGQTWTQSRSGLQGKVWTLAADPDDGQVVYAGTNNGVFKSTDAGASWALTGLTTQTRKLVIDPESPDTLYAGTYGQGVSVSTDGGGTWTAMNDGLTNLKVLSLSLRSGGQRVLFAGTEGGAVFRTDLYTAVAESPGVTRDAARRFPTLARGVLVLTADFGSSCSGIVLLDITGRRVMRLQPGENDVRGVAPGIYFVHAEDGGGRAKAVRKVVIQE
jgi:photosystem II stability/assembly factor-like uncharacterized protein